jgi:hypothetical protein
MEQEQQQEQHHLPYHAGITNLERAPLCALLRLCPFPELLEAAPVLCKVAVVMLTVLLCVSACSSSLNRALSACALSAWTLLLYNYSSSLHSVSL